MLLKGSEKKTEYESQKKREILSKKISEFKNAVIFALLKKGGLGEWLKPVVC